MDCYDTVLSVGAMKDAALYFEHVIMLSLLAEIAMETWHSSGGQTKAIAAALPAALADTQPLANGLAKGFLPPALAENKTFLETYNGLVRLLDLMYFKAAGLPLPPNMSACLTKEEYESLDESAVAQVAGRFFDDFGLASLPLLVARAMVPTISIDDPSGEEVAVTLATLDLVDTTCASWEQITEFRRDPVSRTKLRRLRVFAADSYAGKSRAYVEDDLLRRLDDYDETVRRWGFETRHAVLTTLLNSKSLLAVAGVSLLSVLFGAPTLAGAGALAGAAVEIGRVSVEVSRRRFALRSALRDNPVSYIADAKERLSSTSV